MLVLGRSPIRNKRKNQADKIAPKHIEQRPEHSAF